MADVLLTHSYHLPYDAKQLRKMQPYVPIGTLYAAASLRNRGVSVAVFDAMLELPAERFTTMLVTERPKIVVVYEDDFNFLSKMCLSRMREVAFGIAQRAKEVGATLVVHGSDSTDNPELFLAQGFDFVLCGEAEETLAELCDAVLAGDDVPMLDGLVRREARSPIRLARNPSWTRLETAARDLISLAPYREAWQNAHGYFSTNLVASRGCPYQCNWCAKPISENRFQLRAALAVAEEMRAMKLAGAEHIWFGDDVFALNRHWVREFADAVTAHDAVIPFKVQSRVDLMSEETVRNLQRAGCAEVWMGVESGAQSVLDAMQKGITLAEVERARALLAEAGIRACFFLQLGYPGEGWAELQATAEMVRRLRPDEIGVSVSYPLPGTVFYERVRMQLGEKRNWEESDDLCMMFQGAYSTEFYRAVREALHAEVNAWHGKCDAVKVAALWRALEAMEPESRNRDAFRFDAPRMVSVESLVAAKA